MASCWLLAATCPAFGADCDRKYQRLRARHQRSHCPNATVTAKMTEQQLVRTAETNSEGFYQLLALPSGTYERYL